MYFDFNNNTNNVYFTGFNNTIYFFIFYKFIYTSFNINIPVKLYMSHKIHVRR